MNPKRIEILSQDFPPQTGGIDLSRFSRPNPGVDPKKRLGLKNEKVILTLSRVNERKVTIKCWRRSPRPSQKCLMLSGMSWPSTRRADSSSCKIPMRQ